MNENDTDDAAADGIRVESHARDSRAVTARPEQAGRSPATWRLVAAGAVIVGFFLPWLTVFGGLFAISGYRIPDLAKLVGQLSAIGSGTADPRLFLIYLLYAIPLLALVVIVKQMRGEDVRAIAFLTGAVPILGFLYLTALAGSGLVHMLGSGAFLTLFGAVGLIASSRRQHGR